MSEPIRWAVKGRNGRIDTDTLSFTRVEAIRKYREYFGLTWRYLYRHGARCIRVKVTEVQDGA